MRPEASRLGQNGIYLTDGHLNIAVLKFQPGKNGEPLRLGIDRRRFQVDDVDATVARIGDLGGKPLTDRTEVHPTEIGSSEREEFKLISGSKTTRMIIGSRPNEVHSLGELIANKICRPQRQRDHG